MCDTQVGAVHRPKLYSCDYCQNINLSVANCCGGSVYLGVRQVSFVGRAVCYHRCQVIGVREDFCAPMVQTVDSVI